MPTSDAFDFSSVLDVPVVGPFCYWADRSKSTATIQRTRASVVQLLRSVDRSNRLLTKIVDSCAVYVALNKNNNKLYVGATQKGVRSRSSAHIKNAERGSKGRFQTAIRKHGKEAFEFLIFAYCRDFLHALDIERKLISAIRPEYNLTEGGGGTKGYVWTAEFRTRFSKLMTGRRSPRLGVVLEDESVEKIVVAVTRWWAQKRLDPNYAEFCKKRYENSLAKSNNARKRPIICLDTGEEFSCVAEAAKQFGLRAGLIRSICDYPNQRRGKVYPKFAYKAR